MPELSSRFHDFFYKSGFSRDFSALQGQCSVAEPGPTPSPLIIYCILYYLVITCPTAITLQLAGDGNDTNDYNDDTEDIAPTNKDHSALK